MVSAVETKDTYVSVAGSDFRVELNTQLSGWDMSMPINVEDFTELQSSGVGKIGINVQTELTATMRVNSDWQVLRENRTADNVWAFVHIGKAQAQGSTQFWQANAAGSGMENPTAGILTSALTAAQNGVAYARHTDGATYFDFSSTGDEVELPAITEGQVVVVEVVAATGAGTLKVDNSSTMALADGPRAHAPTGVVANATPKIVLTGVGSVSGWVHIGTALDVD